MPQPALPIKKSTLLFWLQWFQAVFRQDVASLIERHFSSYAYPSEVQSVLECWERIRQILEETKSESLDLADFCENQLAGDPGNLPLFKQIILRYRRYHAAHTEELREKPFIWN